MSRIQFSTLLEEVTGKLAGSVFQDSYIGFQIRSRVSPRNPQTNYQQLRRGEFGFISALWRSLTSIQQGTFVAVAGSIPAALRLFVSANINLSLINEAIIDTYVPSVIPDELPLEIIALNTGSLTVQASSPVVLVPAGTTLLVQATTDKLPTKIFNNPSEYSPIVSFAAGTDLSIPVDIIFDWNAHYGVMRDNRRICIKSATIDKSNGNRSTETVNCAIAPFVAANHIEDSDGTFIINDDGTFVISP